MFEILFCTPSYQFILKFGFIEGLEPSDHFWGNWAQNGLPDITLEPHIQLFNFHKQPLILLEILFHIPNCWFFLEFGLGWRGGGGVWDLMTTFRAIGPKMFYLTLLWNHTFNFHKQCLTLFKMLFHTPSCQFILEICLYWGPGT